MFNMCVRAKYRYGLIIRGVSKEVEEQDWKWEELVWRALLNLRASIGSEEKETKGAVPSRIDQMGGRQGGRESDQEMEEDRGG